MKAEFRSFIQPLKSISVIVSLVIFIYTSQLGATFVTSQSAALKSKYDQQKAEIDKQIGNIQTELGGLNQDFHSIQTQKNSLKEQVAQMQNEIDTITKLITDTKLTISQLEDQIAKNEAQMTKLQEEMQSLIREMQKQQNTSQLEIILTSQNLGDLLSKAHNLSSLQEKLDQLNSRIEEAQKELEENRQKHQETQEQLENTQFFLNSKRDGLKILLEQTEGEEAKYQQLIAEMKAQQNQVEAQRVSVESEYQNALQREREEAARRQREAEEAARRRNTANNRNDSTPSSSPSNNGNCNYTESRSVSVPNGFFIAPTRGFVSQNFWCSGSAGHDGWDIANGIGTPIRAVANGQVVRKGFHSSGFGNFLVLKHNLPSGVSVYSLYAHMRDASVADGSVSQGDVIGYMGSTGWSTGPHLHFMFLSSSFESTNDVGCRLGTSKCYDPGLFL